MGCLGVVVLVFAYYRSSTSQLYITLILADCQYYLCFGGLFLFVEYYTNCTEIIKGGMICVRKWKKAALWKRRSRQWM